MTVEMVDVYGIKDGEQVPLGRMPMSPKMKAKEIIRTYFGFDSLDGDDGSDACMALYACEELIQWMKNQGWVQTNGLIQQAK